MTFCEWPVIQEVAQSCPTLCDPMDCSLPGSSIHGIFQARVLEWGAIAFSVTVYLELAKLKENKNTNLKRYKGTSLVVQQLRICLAMQEMGVQSLVGELRSHMPRSN